MLRFWLVSLTALATVAVPRIAAANMKLDVDLVICTTDDGQDGGRFRHFRGAEGGYLGRITVFNGDGDVIATQDNTMLSLDDCDLHFVLALTNDVLTAVVFEPVTVKVERCQEHNHHRHHHHYGEEEDDDCEFADSAETIVSHADINTPFDGLVDLFGGGDSSGVIAYINEQIAIEQGARAAADATLQTNITNGDNAVRNELHAFESDAITAVTAGLGLTGGGSSGDIGLAVDPAVIQRRVTGSCPTGSALVSVNEDGSVNCISVDTDPGDDITALAAGAGIVIEQSGSVVTVTNSGDTNAADDVNAVTAGAGISIGGTASNPTITNTGDTNGADDITTITVTGGLTVAGGANSAELGHVTWECPANSSIRVIGANGTVMCEADDTGGGGGDNLGNHTATTDLNMNNHSITNLVHAFGSSADYVYYGTNSDFGSTAQVPYFDVGGFFQGPSAGVRAWTDADLGMGLEAFNTVTGAFGFVASGDRGIEASGPGYGGLFSGGLYGVYVTTTGNWAAYMDGNVDGAEVFNRNTGEFMKSKFQFNVVCGGCGGLPGFPRGDSCSCGFMCTAANYVCMTAI